MTHIMMYTEAVKLKQITVRGLPVEIEKIIRKEEKGNKLQPGTHFLV